MLQAESVVRLVVMVCVIITLCAACGPEAEDLTSGALASCQYINGFSGERECKEYLGSNWSDARMRADLVAGQECDRSSLQGICAVEPGTVEASNIVFSSTTGSTCDELSLGCFFASGDWLPSEPCGGSESNQP
jgi:hypothetical protein